MPLSSPSMPKAPFFEAFGNCRSLCRIGFEKRIGTSLKVSTPAAKESCHYVCSRGNETGTSVPATIMSALPARIFSAPVEIHWLLEMQACVIVFEGTEMGKPARTAASAIVMGFTKFT